jgi:transposase
MFVTPECLDGHDDCTDLMCDMCGLGMSRVVWLVAEDVVLVQAA